MTRTLAAVIWPANFVSASDPNDHPIRPMPMITQPPAPRACRWNRRTPGELPEAGEARKTPTMPEHRQPTHPRVGVDVHISLPQVGDGSQATGQHPHRTVTKIGGQLIAQAHAAGFTPAPCDRPEDDKPPATPAIAGHLETILHQRPRAEHSPNDSCEQLAESSQCVRWSAA